jgi:hypothetical protein
MNTWDWEMLAHNRSESSDGDGEHLGIYGSKKGIFF